MNSNKRPADDTGAGGDASRRRVEPDWAVLEAEAKYIARKHANQAVVAAKAAVLESAAVAEVDASLFDESKDATAFLKSVPDAKVRAAAMALASLEGEWEGHVAEDSRLSALDGKTKVRLFMAYNREVAEYTFKGLNGLDVDTSLSDVVTPEGSTINLKQFYEAKADQFNGKGRLEERGKELSDKEAQLMERALLAAMLMYQFEGGPRAVRELNNVIKKKVKDGARRLKAIKAFQTEVAPVVIFQDLKPKKESDPEHFVVASCGTRGPMSNIWDWICDIKVLMEQPSGGLLPKGIKLHTGFYGAFRDLADADETVNEKLADLRVKHPGCTFTFTGHSLGGAVAQLLAISHAIETDSKSRLVTFGCPRGGDDKFQELSEARTEHIRVRAIGDPIAGVPTERKLLPWSYPAHRADKYLLVQDDMPAILEKDGSKPVEKVRFLFSATYFLYRFYSNHRGYQYAAGVLSHFGVELDVKSSWWNPFD